MDCNTCGQPFKAKGYLRRRDGSGVLRPFVVFRCGCPAPWLSCYTVKEYEQETGQRIKQIYRSPRTVPPPGPPASDGVEYRTVPGFVAYKAGSDGSVWSCRHKTGLAGRWKRLRPRDSGCTTSRPVKGGYKAVVLTSKDGERKAKLVHVVVLEAFVGPRPAGMECCHNNGDPADNRLENLRWDTHRNNIADSQAQGNIRRGSRHQFAKLTESQVLEMIQLRASGVSFRKLAARFGVRHQTVHGIVAGKYWAHVGPSCRRVSPSSAAADAARRALAGEGEG
jgi:hypothetical protein